MAPRVISSQRMVVVKRMGQKKFSVAKILCLVIIMKIENDEDNESGTERRKEAQDAIITLSPPSYGL